MCLWLTVFIWRMSASYKKHYSNMCQTIVSISFREKMGLLILPRGRFIAQISISSLAQQLFLFSVYVCMCVSCSVASNSLQPQVLQPARLLFPWNSPGKNTGLPFSSPGFLPNPGTKPGSSAFQAHSLSSEPLGKPILCFYIFMFPYH